MLGESLDQGWSDWDACDWPGGPWGRGEEGPALGEDGSHEVRMQSGGQGRGVG